MNRRQLLTGALAAPVVALAVAKAKPVQTEPEHCIEATNLDTPDGLREFWYIDPEDGHVIRTCLVTMK